MPVAPIPPFLWNLLQFKAAEAAAIIQTQMQADGTLPTGGIMEYAKNGEPYPVLWDPGRPAIPPVGDGIPRGRGK